MNYSIRNLVIAGGLAIVAIAAVLIYTSNVQQAAKEGQARVKVYGGPRRRAGGHARRRTSLRAAISSRRKSSRTTSSPAC